LLLLLLLQLAAVVQMRAVPAVLVVAAQVPAVLGVHLELQLAAAEGVGGLQVGGGIGTHCVVCCKLLQTALKWLQLGGAVQSWV
jgi:hypothetical protein